MPVIAIIKSIGTIHLQIVFNILAVNTNPPRKQGHIHLLHFHTHVDEPTKIHKISRKFSSLLSSVNISLVLAIDYVFTIALLLPYILSLFV